MGRKFFKNKRKLIAYFSTSAIREKQLKALQKNEDYPVGVMKFSETRWSGIVSGLARLHRLSGAIQHFHKHESEEKRIELNLST